MPNIARAAAEILRTDRTLSKDFREEMALAMEALDECYSALEMTERTHEKSGQPFWCKGLDMARAVLRDEKPEVPE